MRRFKFWAIGLVSFFSIAAGTMLHRVLAVSLCTVLGFNSTVCYLGDGDQVNAAVPPERSDVGAIIAQGTDIFRNEGENPSSPSTPNMTGRGQGNLSGDWIFKTQNFEVKYDGSTTSCIPLSNSQLNYPVSLTQNGNKLVMSPAANAVERYTTFVGSGQISGNRVSMSAEFVSFDGTISSDGNQITGNIDCLGVTLSFIATRTGSNNQINSAVSPRRSDASINSTQTVDIFRNDGGSSQQQQTDIFKNPNPQSTPQPGVDIFNNPNAPNRPIQQQPTVGSGEAIWIYSAYAAPSPDYVIFSTPIKITNTGNDTIASVCENCQPSQLPANFFESKTPLKKAIVADFKNLSSTSIETVESTDGEAIWGVIYEKNSTREVYFTLGKIPNHNTKINKISKTNISQIQTPILASNALVNLKKSLPLLIGPNTSAASKQGILVSSLCIPTNLSQWISNAKNAELLKTNLIVGEAERQQAVITYNVGQIVAKNTAFYNFIIQKTYELKSWLGKGNQIPINYPISLKEYQLKMERNNRLLATNSFLLQDPNLVAQCIPPQVLGTLSELAGIAALATLIAVIAIVAEWCINNPVGCKALARNPGATARALINTPPQPQQTAQQSQTLKGCRVPKFLPAGAFDPGDCVIQGPVMTTSGFVDGVNACGICNTMAGAGGSPPDKGSCRTRPIDERKVPFSQLSVSVPCPANWDRGW